jgi:hypothetical protein
MNLNKDVEKNNKDVEKYNKVIEKYNKICDKHFITDINNKYNIIFYSNTDEQKYIILKMNDKTIWATYKILCSYDEKFSYLKLAKDMIIINKNILDNKFNLKDIQNENDLLNEIYTYVSESKYIGFVIKKKGNINFYFCITKIIRL